MKIQISKSRYVEDSRALADLRLGERSFLPGEIVMVNYQESPDTIGVIIAIGIKEGTGPDCYRIISTGGTVKVRDVVNKLPDVSKLVHGELYVYQDNNGTWNYVYLEGSSRVIKPIDGGPYVFIDLESNRRWFYRDQTCKREDDFFTTSQVTDLLGVLGDTMIRATVISDRGYIFKVGDVKDLVLTPSVIEEISGKNVTGECVYLVGGVETGLDENGKLNILGVTGDTEIDVIIRYPLVPGIYSGVSVKVPIKFGHTFYYGPVDDTWVPDIQGIQSLSGTLINYRRSWEWTEASFTYKRIAVAYPKKYGYLSHIFDDNGLDYIRTYQAYSTEVTIDGEPYLVYIKSDKVSVSSFTQRFVFNDSESLEFKEETLLDVVGAWKNKNSYSGLVVLNEEGKIEKSLLEDSVIGTFTLIKNIVTEYPTGGMAVGDVFYNRITKKLFIAIDEETGLIENPIVESLYIYRNEFYFWTESGLQKFSGIQSREINTIKEIYGRT